MIRVEISRASGKVVHIADPGTAQEKRTVVTGLPPQADLKAIEARIKAMGLRHV